jgi:CRP/FNR family transcriptional regulator, cyclic AMP receptor protein
MASTSQNPERFFRSLPLFAGAPPDALRAFSRKTRFLSFPKGGSIFNEGDPADGAWWVAEGCVKIVKTGFQGRAVTMDLLMRGDAFGPAVLLDSAKIHPTGAVCIVRSGIVKAPSSDLFALMKTWPTFAQALLVQAGRRLHRSWRLRTSEGEPADRKVAATLLTLRDVLGPSLTISRREIADIAGVAPETAIRVMLTFKRRGWTVAAPGLITLKRPDRLQSFVEG